MSYRFLQIEWPLYNVPLQVYPAEIRFPYKVIDQI